MEKKENDFLTSGAGLMTRKETAKYLSCGLNTLDGLGIPRIKLSVRRYAYLKKDVDKWINDHRENCGGINE